MTPQSEPKGLPPMQIGEGVLRTVRCEAMNRWWQTVLGISPFLESERFAFRRLPSDYPYTQLLIVFNRPELGDRESSGPVWIMYSFDTPHLVLCSTDTKYSATWA